MIDRLAVYLAALLLAVDCQVLTPSQITISHRKPVSASATCGEVNGQPFNEVYCSLTGSTQYTPLTSYSYQDDQDDPSVLQELRNPREAFIQGGHGCGHCMANSINAHPSSNMVDGNNSWWMSPPLSRGLHYNQINITIDLEQEFHVAYVWIQMANSPRPGSWVLERSTDHGATYQPWFHFAENSAECMRRFGIESLSPISDDDSVVCRTDMASLQPLENAEMVIRILEHRPSSRQFATSEALQNFTRATNVRIRLLGTRTLQGHLMDISKANRDPTVTRRYFYAIKEIMIGGRCVCNGHAVTCDILDPKRPRALLCRCEHGTCGDMCERCCPGFEQKKWQPTTAHNNFTCEPCNCHGRTNDCVYDQQLDDEHLSLDIHGNYEGGGRCQNCRYNTEGINCDKCVKGFFRPEGVSWDELQPCQQCQCDPSKHTGSCEEGTGRCECQPRFEGELCDRCAKGYYDPPECRPCECAVNGTIGEVCLPENGQCPCKDGFGGAFCETCAPGFTNVTAGCQECVCDETGSEHSNCSAISGQCDCKAAFDGISCEKCRTGYFDHPKCTFCNCDPMGTEGGVCDQTTGQCLCKEGFAGEKCDHCDIGFYGYPNCKPCGCDGAGTSVPECDPVSGQCPCSSNFTGRTCDKCAAGFFDYPDCKACSCLLEGAKGQTCDQTGQCYCKGNFEGERCDRCKPNLYNFPTCEECNCNPSGVSVDFAGCDKVAPGELCTCRKHVTGRICDQCRPTYWDLQYHHTDGCIECSCNPNGTVSQLNTCQQQSGQCQCKKNAAGRQCEQCAAGFYNLQAHNQLGCEPCNCDIGGALRADCDIATGQCKCRPRVTGVQCDAPIDNHYFPTLWHHQYEAEDGRTEDQRPVRFAVDAAQFPDFSWRGYAVFSPIQEKIYLDVDIAKASVYRLLFRYANPTPVAISAVVAAAPRFTHTQDVEQSTKVTFEPTQKPDVKAITVDGKPFVLNPGKWAISIATKQRLFLDYIVLLPAEYYEGQILREQVHAPCHANSTKSSTCMDLLYPPLSTTAPRADVENDADTFVYVNGDGTTTPVGPVPIEILPPDVTAPAAFVRSDDLPRVVEAKVDVSEDADYGILLEYHNAETTANPVVVNLSQDGQVKLNGSVIIHNCPYATFCRELVVSQVGEMAVVALKKGQATIRLHVAPNHEFGLAAINLVKKSGFGPEYLQQVPVCVRKEGRCMPQTYPPAAESVVTEAETGAANEKAAISADKLPFAVANAKEVKVVPLDDGQGTVEISGVVPTRGHYMFIVHYFNSDSTLTDVDVLLQNEHYFQASVPFAFCPSVSGCRALIKDKERGAIQFWMDDKYTATFYHNATQKGPIFIDSITAVPYHSFNENLMRPQAIDLSEEYVKQCGDKHFENRPDNHTDYCRAKIFSLTTDFNAAALSCDCIAQGSESFSCEKYGGQCKCKANIIGRRCERCAPGFYNFPECIKCQCTAGQQCDERSGQCFCPPHVEGASCDRCVGQAFGYDPLIGCQKCDCHPQGSEGGNLLCDPESGQCLCREAVGGRQCDRCLAGSYGFPHCHACSCARAGTTDEICDPTNAQCRCKENVYGQRCDTCKAGTFDLSAENPLGCGNCFCFGVTDSCRSSNFPVETMSVDMSQFLTTDDSGLVDNQEYSVVYTAEEMSPPSVYFLAPIEVGKDYTTSYGLQLTFKLQVTPKPDVRKKMSSEPDVRLTGANMTIEFWASEQPSKIEEEFTVKCRLVPEHFLTTDGRPVTREQLMQVLHSLTKVALKASYVDSPKTVTLNEFGLEFSSPELPQSVMRASSVEQCQCPAPYTGPSCQQCASGYYRVQSGEYLGSCIPCDCNGHSGTCNPDTGTCSDCEHNTHGDHCEYCDEGHYGDATTGDPYACLPCACPFLPSNNFAKSCVVSDEGQVQQCTCQPGYTGERCERCAPGFFGQPSEPGGSCQPCQCNSNNNLTDSRACHPVSGDCYLCEGNTDGRRCEWCAPWFHGDAVAAKNCTACECDQCGSAHCDNRAGICQCKPNVEGDGCDRCKPDYFGFSNCRGCEPCHCGVASFTSQCNGESGQCNCRPGAAGQRCAQCEHGYWNYGEHGCDKCDCESDLSLGTVCDVRTGQCHCQEGATGPRCDQCLPSYLRIPTLGCRRCDECVHHLIGDVDSLDLEVDVLGMTIGNISAASVVGARLARNRKNLVDYTEVSKIGQRDGSKYGNLYGDADEILGNHTSLINYGNRTKNIGMATAALAKNLTFNATETYHEIVRRAQLARGSVQSLREIAASIGSHATALNVDPRLLQDAEATLHQLEATSSLELPEVVNNASAKLETIIAQIGVELEKSKAQKAAVETQKKQSAEIGDYLNAAQQLLKESKAKSDTANSFSKTITTKKVDTIVAAIDDNTNRMETAKADFEAVKIGLKNATENTKDTAEAIQTSLATLNDTRVELQEATEASRIRRAADIDVQALRVKAHGLAQQAAELNNTFAGTRQDSSNAVDAANAYSTLTTTLQNAQLKADQALKLINDNQDGIEKLNERVQKALDESTASLKSADEIRQSALNALEKDSKKVKLQLDKLAEEVEALRKGKDAVKTKISSPINQEVVDDIQKKVDQVQSLKKEIEDALEKTREQIQDVTQKAGEVADKANGAIQGLKQAKSNAKQLKELAPQVSASFEKLQKLSADKSAKVENINGRVKDIKELIDVARNAVNRIKLGARFDRGSSLDLTVPPTVAALAAHTHISFYMSTMQEHGIPLFFGNEEHTSGSRAVPTDDYIAVELEYGAPKVTVNLGDGPLVVKLNTRVSDGEWRRVDVERIGKTVNVTVSQPGSEQRAESAIGQSTGSKSVLNLHPTISRLFVGGIPQTSRISRDIHNREFSGAVEGVKLNGEPIGLWNVQENGVQRVEGARRRPKFVGAGGEESAISLDGEGYAVYKRDHWNPRKTTKISLSFQTFSPDGLLFFVGKERDFMSLELLAGSLKLSVDLGSGVGQWTTEADGLNDGQWHTVNIIREEKKVRLEVDGKSQEGETPGKETEMSVTESFYVGGTPTGINVRTPTLPFRGCLTKVKLGSDEVDLTASQASKGVRNSCPLGTVRTVSVLSERASARFNNVSAEEDVIEVTLKFKTTKASGTLFTVSATDDDNLLALLLTNGVLTATSGDEKVALELAPTVDAKWHYVSVRRTPTTLEVNADDLFSAQKQRAGESGDHGDSVLAITFGKGSDVSFVGCVGDVTVNGKLLDFAKAEDSKELSLSGCSLKDEPLVGTTVAPAVILPMDDEETTPMSTTTTTTTTTTTEAPTTEAPAEPRPDDSCALPEIASEMIKDADGTRFGNQPNSRIEYAVVPEAFDKSGTFSLKVRPTAFSGVFFLATNDKRTDHIALLLDQGRVVFSFDGGAGQTVLRTNQSILDGRWHDVKASRKGTEAHLVVDDESVDATVVDESVDTLPPFYLGGVPNELASYVRSLIPTARTQLSGCVRDAKLNGKPLSAGKHVGTEQCAARHESGIYFGHQGGYAIVDKQFELGDVFSAELDVRPRSKNGVVFSVGVLDYLVVQFIDGSIKLTVDSGSGAEHVIYTPPQGNAMCDGQWHNLKVMKKKNILTLTVNGKSNLKILKKAGNALTKDPLYLGGVPEAVTNKGLETRESFRGCIRFVNFGKLKEKRVKKNVNVDEFELVGDVTKGNCPVN